MYEQVIRPVLDVIGHSEGMHKTIRAGVHLFEQNPLGLALLEHNDWGKPRFSDPRLRVHILDTDLESPLFEGAGWDKNGVAVRGMHTAGFDGIVVGGVLLNSQKGNTDERQWAHEDKAVNYIGLESHGLDQVERNLQKYAEDGISIFINIANNHDVTPENAPDAFAKVAKRLTKYKFIKGFQICICPNRDETLAFMDPPTLTDISKATVEAADGKPVLIKAWPKQNRRSIDDFIQIALDHGLRGIISANTVVDPAIKDKYDFSRGKPGGFSGNDPDFKYMKIIQLAYIRRQAGHRLEQIASGGIDTPFEAYRSMKAGANGFEVNTGLRSKGFTVASQIKRGLVDLMNRETTLVYNIREIVGVHAYDYRDPN